MSVRIHDGSSEHEHDEGGAIAIKDGHLLVLTHQYTNGETVAIYAPGHWQMAYVEKAAAE